MLIETPLLAKPFKNMFLQERLKDCQRCFISKPTSGQRQIELTKVILRAVGTDTESISFRVILFSAS